MTSRFLLARVYNRRARRGFKEVESARYTERNPPSPPFLCGWIGIRVPGRVGGENKGFSLCPPHEEVGLFDAAFTALWRVAYLACPVSVCPGL